MIADGYQDRATLERRIEAMEAWLANPSLLRRDPDARDRLKSSLAAAGVQFTDVI